MEHVGFLCLAVIWLTVGTYGQDANKPDESAGKSQRSPIWIAGVLSEAEPEVNFSHQRTFVAPVFRQPGEAAAAHVRFADMRQTDKKGPGVSIAFGMDLVSRFVWRGIDLGDAPAFQPSASVSFGGLKFGAWGSYAFSAPAGTRPFSEFDWFFQYSDSTSLGTLTAALTDYYFPNDGLKFFNYKGGNEGAHTLEVSLNYEGNERLPLNLLAAVNVHNDTSGSIYLEIGHSFDVGDVSVKAFAGGAVGASAWYDLPDNGFRFVNVGLTLSRALQVSSTFSLPVSVSVGVNPASERSFLVFEAGL